jgi:hypothetical protein
LALRIGKKDATGARHERPSLFYAIALSAS